MTVRNPAKRGALKKYALLAAPEFTGLTTVDRLNMSGGVTASSYVRLAKYTSTELNDITDAVNTGSGKLQSAMVYNTTLNTPVWAVDNADGSVWVDGTGATRNTPV